MKPEIIYGIHPVLEALKAGRRQFVDITVAPGKSAKRIVEIRRIARSFGISVREEPSTRARATKSVDHNRRISARVSPYPLERMTDIIDRVESAGVIPFLLMLDHIVDPNNLGALARTALAVGIDGVIISRHRSASPSPTVSKASAGALEHIHMAKATNMTQAINELQQRGIWVAGMDRHAQNTIFDSDLSGPIAIIIGGEEKGIRPLVKRHCDMMLSIPQKGSINSLNASAAGAVVLYEAFRQRAAGNRSRHLTLSGR